MIECVEENIYYVGRKRRQNKKAKRLLSLILVFFISGSAFFYTDKIVLTNVFNVCYDNLYVYSAKAVNECVFEEITDGYDYAELVKIEKNSAGDIVLITAHSAKINALNRKIALKTEEKLVKTLKQGVSLPLFAFSGISIISGYGPEICFKSLSLSGVTCDFKDGFVSAGINQTMHSLYIEVVCSYYLNAPIYKKTGECRTSVLLSESIIVGKIPEIYLNRT